MIPPFRVAMYASHGGAGRFVGVLAALFIVAVISLAGATPLPRPRPDLPEPPAGDFGKHKRQIFREQVSPHTGGKIPEDAFRADRLALNKLQQAGFSVPDGVQLHWRGHGHNGEPGHHGHGPPGHPDGHTHDADPHFSVIKIVQTEDGRYVPTEGAVNNQHPNTVDSTYVVRTPAGWNQHASQLVGLQRPVGPPLQIPGTAGVGGGHGGGPLRRPFNPSPAHHHSQPAPAPSPPPLPPAPQHPPQQDDVNLTPFPSPALQPPPNVPSINIPLYHHKPLPPPGPAPGPPPARLHPLEVPQPPKSIPAPAVSPTPPPRPPPPRPPPPRKFHFGGPAHHHIPHSLSALIDIEAHHPGPGRDLGLFGSSFESSHNEASLLSDASPFLLDDDWASELPGGLLSPEQLAALYNSDHEERLQHLHSLASF